jgi:hypothetical protein
MQFYDVNFRFFFAGMKFKKDGFCYYFAIKNN